MGTTNFCRWGGHEWRTVTLKIKGRGSLTTEAFQECARDRCDRVRVVPRTLVDYDSKGGQS